MFHCLGSGTWTYKCVNSVRDLIHLVHPSISNVERLNADVGNMQNVRDQGNVSIHILTAVRYEEADNYLRETGHGTG